MCVIDIYSKYAWVLVKMIICRYLASECNKACKNDDYVDIKICLCEKRQFDKLILTCEIEMLNTTEILLNYKNITSEKSNGLIHIISLVIICLSLLFVISISCYFYYTKY